MMPLLAQVGLATLGSWVIVLIVVGALIAILMLALGAMGIAVPDTAKKAVWIIVVAVFAIVAVKVLLSVV